MAANSRPLEIRHHETTEIPTRSLVESMLRDDATIGGVSKPRELACRLGHWRTQPNGIIAYPADGCSRRLKASREFLEVL